MLAAPWQANSNGQSIGDRLIPHEAMYIILNVAMADTSWSRVSDALQYPAVMLVDYVRVWQRAAAINVGCNPPSYPTQQEIACKKEEYLSPAEVEEWKLGVCNNISSQARWRGRGWQWVIMWLLVQGSHCVVPTLVCYLRPAWNREL